MKRQEQFHCRFLDYRLLGSCLLSCLLICLARTTLHASESNFNALNDTIAADVALPDSLLTDDNVYRYTFSNFPWPAVSWTSCASANSSPPIA